MMYTNVFLYRILFHNSKIVLYVYVTVDVYEVYNVLLSCSLC